MLYYNKQVFFAESANVPYWGRLQKSFALLSNDCYDGLTGLRWCCPPAADSVGRGFTRRFDNCAISVGKHLAKRAEGEIDNETQSGDSVGTDPYVL